MTLPALSWEALDTGAEGELAELRHACERWGAFYLVTPALASVQQQALGAVEAFFDLPPADKAALDIGAQPHFRGYSHVFTADDDREQLHLGPERQGPERPLTRGPAHAALIGPNAWPRALGERFKQAMTQYAGAIAQLGAQLLAAIGRALELDVAALGGLLQPDPYLLLKPMRYAPRRARAGVSMAPHCDFSLITLVLQRGAGLEIRDPKGRWVAAPAHEGTLLVNLGELLEVLSAGRVRATPHRVRAAHATPRLSLPAFLNPDLGRVVSPPAAYVKDHTNGHTARHTARGTLGDTPRQVSDEGTSRIHAASHEHVHRVWSSGEPYAGFVFGEREWARKGLGRWCYQEACWAGR